MEMISKIEYLAPHVAQHKFNVEQGMADSITGASVSDFNEDDTYANDGEWQ